MFNVTGLARGLSIGKIIGGLSKTLQIANQIIPLYQRAKPAIANARSMLSVLKEINKKDNVSSNNLENKPSNTKKINIIPKEKTSTPPTFFL